ncbi:hypothetical protein GCM10009665_23230 [Kitasatospora nipponensis]|uniref:Helix-turn-helix protein n=1 Tax=Kitasatospora nipponensis TaxID=258049 RepID=A0ABN1W5G1_9ACTN
MNAVRTARSGRYAPEALAALPPAIPLSVANELLSLGRTAGYRMAREHRYPVTVVEVGGSYRVITADLLHFLRPRTSQSAA